MTNRLLLALGLVLGSCHFCFGATISNFQHTATAFFEVTSPFPNGDGANAGGEGHFRFRKLPSEIDSKRITGTFSASFLGGVFHADQLVEPRLFATAFMDGTTLEVRHIDIPGVGVTSRVLQQSNIETPFEFFSSSFDGTPVPGTDDILLPARIAFGAFSDPVASSYARLSDVSITLTFDLEGPIGLDLPVGRGQSTVLETFTLRDSVDLAVVPAELAPFITAVPEPNALVMFSSVGMLLSMRRKRRR